jgi:hypothetical protein
MGIRKLIFTLTEIKFIDNDDGKIIEKMEKKKVRLTIDNGLEDIEAKKEYERIGLREIKIQRITEEALEQSGVLSQEDISISWDGKTGY